MTTIHIPHVALYTTSACHLCELAEELISTTCPNLAIHTIEIAEDETLMQRYGEKIPVLHRFDTHAELNWPFSAAEIQDFLAI